MSVLHCLLRNQGQSKVCVLRDFEKEKAMQSAAAGRMGRVWPGTSSKQIVCMHEESVTEEVISLIHKFQSEMKLL